MMTFPTFIFNNFGLQSMGGLQTRNGLSTPVINSQTFNSSYKLSIKADDSEMGIQILLGWLFTNDNNLISNLGPNDALTYTKSMLAYLFYTHFIYELCGKAVVTL